MSPSSSFGGAWQLLTKTNTTVGFSTVIS
jgi:hypothetical protein